MHKIKSVIYDSWILEPGNQNSFLSDFVLFLSASVLPVDMRASVSSPSVIQVYLYVLVYYYLFIFSVMKCFPSILHVVAVHCLHIGPLTEKLCKKKKKQNTIIVIEIHLIYLGVDKEREKPSFYGDDIHIADHFRMILMLLVLLSL